MDDEWRQVTDRDFAQPITSDRVMTMKKAQRRHVEEYSVKVLVNGGWKQVAHAYAIGHKKIDIFDLVTAKSVRLKLLETSGRAGIREFGVFNGGAVRQKYGRLRRKGSMSREEDLV